VLVCDWGDLVCVRGELFALGYKVRGEGVPHNTMRKGEGVPHNTMRKGEGSLRTTGRGLVPTDGIRRLL
jgi:hypothetical protein